MSNEIKIKQKEKQKSKNTKKKQQQVSKKQESKKIRKISEKYLKEDIQIENILKSKNLNDNDDEYARNKQDEIDFFCDPFSSIPLHVEKLRKNEKIEDENESEKEDAEISHKSDEQHSNNSSPNTHMASTYIGQDCETVVEKFELTRISFDEFEVLFYPKAKPVSLIKINDEERNLSCPEEDDDGFFSYDPPKINRNSNMLLLLDRLNESNATEFITGKGELKNFEKITGDDVYRLRCDRIFTPIYVPPTQMTFEPIDKIITEKKFLKIFITNLMFEQHKKFTNEHYAEKIVEKIFSEYERRQKFDVVGTLHTKLKKLREAKEESLSRSKVDDVSITQQIKNVRNKLHAEELYDQKILKSLLENWKHLKDIRAQQKYSLTNTTIKIHKKDVDIEVLQTERQQQYDTELNEIVNEEFEKYYAAKQRYKDQIKSISQPDKILDSQEILQKPKKPDIDKIVSQLNEIYDEISTNNPKLEIILIHNDQDKSREKIKKLSKVSYNIELEVDGEVVGSTKKFKLNESFSIPIQSAFVLKLTKHIPEKLKLIVSFFRKLEKL